MLCLEVVDSNCHQTQTCFKDYFNQFTDYFSRWLGPDCGCFREHLVWLQCLDFVVCLCVVRDTSMEATMTVGSIGVFNYVDKFCSVS